MGPDLIHNRMLKNLNNTNRVALTHLINTLFISGFVPEVWKSATVIPISSYPRKHDYNQSCQKTIYGNTCYRTTESHLGIY
jgi:hypothetical protein